MSDEPIRLKSNRVFIVGGYSHVPPHQMSDHISFFDAVSMIMQYRYGLRPEYALRDNESKLEKLPYETQRGLCYVQDKDSVIHAGFLVAILDHASTGTGQELEAAAEHSIPIIALMRGKEGVRVDVGFTVRNNHHNGQETLNLTRGVGGLSKMVDGNPMIIERIAYSEYSQALRKLDATVQKKFRLTPITERMRKAQQYEMEHSNPKMAAEIGAKAALLDNLLTFDPELNTAEKYEKAFPQIRRLPINEIEPPTRTQTKPRQRN